MNGLENLKKGDKVTIIHQHSFGDTYIQGGFEVDHVTATLVVGKSSLICGTPHPGNRIRIATGKEAGDDRFSRTSYYASTDPYVAAIRKAQDDAQELAVLKASVESAVKSSYNKTALINALKSLIAEAEKQPEQPATQPATHPE